MKLAVFILLTVILGLVQATVTTQTATHKEDDHHQTCQATCPTAMKDMAKEVQGIFVQINELVTELCKSSEGGIPRHACVAAEKYSKKITDNFETMEMVCSQRTPQCSKGSKSGEEAHLYDMSCSSCVEYMDVFVEYILKPLNEVNHLLMEMFCTPGDTVCEEFLSKIINLSSGPLGELLNDEEGKKKFCTDIVECKPYARKTILMSTIQKFKESAM